MTGTEGTRRLARILVVLVLGLVMLCLAAIAALALMGPFEVPAFRRLVTEQIRTFVGPDVEVDVRGGELALDGYLPVLSLERITLTTAGGALTLKSINSWVSVPALFSFNAAAKRIEIAEADIVAAPEDLLALLAVSADPTESRRFDQITGALVHFDQAMANLEDGLRDGLLPEIAIQRGTLRLGERIRSFQVNLGLSDGALSAVAQLTGVRGASVVLRRADRPDGGGRYSQANLSDLRLADVLPILAEPTSLVRSDAPVFIEVQAGRDTGNTLDYAQLSASIGASYVYVGPDHATILDEAQLSFVYKPEEHTFDAAGTRIFVGGDGLEFKGFLAPARFENVAGLDLALVSDAITATDPDRPGVVEMPGGAFLHMRLPDGASTLEIPRAEVALGTAWLSGRGFVEMIDGAPAFGFVGASSVIQLRELRALWPIFIAPGAREWVMDNVKAGEFGPAEVTLAITPDMIEMNGDELLLRAPAVSLTAPFENLAFTVIGDLPMVEGVSGTMTGTARTFEATGTSGHMTMASGKTIGLDDFSFVIRETSGVAPPGNIAISGSGPASAFVEFSQLDPLASLIAPIAAASAVTGMLEAQIYLGLPLAREVAPETVGYQINLKLDDVSVATPLEGRTLSAFTGSIVATGEGVRVRGRGRLDNLPAEIDYRVGQDAGVSVEATLDAAARERMGLDFGDRLTGSIAIETGEPDDDGSQTVRVDLTQATLNMPEIGWRKAAGRAARAEVTYRQQGERVSISALSITAPGLSASGTAEINNGALVNLRLNRVSVDGLGRFQLSMSRQGNENVFDIESGELTVSRRLFSSLNTGNEGAASTRISVTVARLLSENGSLNDVRLTLGTRSGVIERFDMAAGLSSGGQLRGTMSDQPGAIRIISSDAGEVFRFFDLYNKVQGGALSATLRPDLATGALNGNIFVEDFRIVGETAMGQLVATESQIARMERDDVRDQRTPSTTRESGDNVIIDKFGATFARTADALTIQDAIIKGPSIGMTLRGTIGYAADRVAITGTYIPFFRINNFFSQIPIFGQALGNRANEGLLGVTFEIAGPVRQPTLRVNPASVLAPGLLRSLFDFR